MTGAGGWPMSVFCTPDGRPFFGGTYFPPPTATACRPSAGCWRRWPRPGSQRRPEVEEQADALVAAMSQDLGLADRLATRPAAAGGAPRFADLLGAVEAQLAERFDPEWGGFGPAPKFPRPTLVELLPAAPSGRPATRPR